MISAIEANKTLPCSRSTRTRTRSPGAASETKTVFPSAWANPIPPGRIRSTSTSRVTKRISHAKAERRKGRRQKKFFPIVLFVPFCAFLWLNVKEAETRNRELLSQTLQQEIVERLLVHRGIHLRAIGFELILHNFYQLIQRA